MSKNHTDNLRVTNHYHEHERYHQTKKIIDAKDCLLVRAIRMKNENAIFIFPEDCKDFRYKCTE